MTAVMRGTSEAPTWRGHLLEIGDVCTVRHCFKGPVSLTVRTWGVTRLDGPFVAGHRRSALVKDILIVERDGRRLS